MPFPLAHPAAVLLLRNQCPKHFSFGALVIGSLIPDMTNCLNLDLFSHSLGGSLLLDLPVGCVMLIVLARFRAALVGILPYPHREALLFLCSAKMPSFFTLGASLLIGIWLHIGWDSFTHEYGWFTQRMGMVALSFSDLGTWRIKIDSLLWHASTWGGTAAVFGAYLSFLKRYKVAARIGSSSEWQAYVRCLTILFGPMVFSVIIACGLSSSQDSVPYVARWAAEIYLPSLFVTLALVGVHGSR